MRPAFDVRLPLGVLFALCGGILVLHGAWVGIRVVGININLWWGIVMIAFGMGFLVLGGRSRTSR